MGGGVGSIRSLVSARSLKLECAIRSLVCSLIVLGSCMSHWWCLFLRMEERSMISDVQMDNLRGLLGIRRMDKVRMHG